MAYRGREFDEHGRTVRGEDLYDSTRDQHYDRTKDPFSVTATNPTVALAELRRSIGDVINRAAYAGERVVITRNGTAAAALISAEDFAYFEELENAADAAALDAARARDDGYRISIDELTGAASPESEAPK